MPTILFSIGLVAATSAGWNKAFAFRQPATVQVMEQLDQTPVRASFAHFLVGSEMGIDFQPVATREMHLMMGRAYWDALKINGKNQWAAASCAGRSENPFCAAVDGEASGEEKNIPEVLRGSRDLKNKIVKGRTGSVESGLRSGVVIKEAILNGRWIDLVQATDTEFYRAFAAMKPSRGKRAQDQTYGLQFWTEHARNWLSDATIPNGFFVALGSRLEDYLPDPEVLKLVTQSYERGFISKGNARGESNAKAGFRAALFHITQNEFVQADKILNALTDAMMEPAAVKSFDSRLKYWKIYVAHQLNRSADEIALKKQMDVEFPLSLHGLISSRGKVADRLLKIEKPDLQLQFRSQVVPELNSPLIALEVLTRLGAPAGFIRPFAQRVSELAGGSESSVKIYISVLLNRMGSDLDKFRLMSQLFKQDPTMISEQTLELFFPLWHFPTIHQYGRLHELDPFLVIAIMRQESAFDEHARSPAGALGLLQMMPATALHLAHVRAKDLLKADVNIQVGTKFFSNLMSRFESDPIQSLAAYNAGPLKVREWMKRYPGIENPLLFTDLIPFKETREYVAAIMRNYYWYARLYSDDWKSVLKPFKIFDEENLPQ